MSAYYSIHTQYGLDADTASTVSGIPVKLTHLLLGDGGGSAVTPGQQIVHEVLRLSINRVYQDPADTAGIYTVEAVVQTVPAAIMVREFSILDQSGGTYAHGSLPLTEVNPTTASAQTGLVLRVKVFSSNGATIALNSSGAIATQDWVLSQLTPAQTTPGGTTGQVWSKKSNADGDCEWRDPSTATIVVDTVEEEISLTDGQTVITLALTTTRGLALYLDGERLPESAWAADEDIANQLTLVNAISGSDHKLIACQNEPTANTPTPLEKAKNLADLPNAATARQNLGDVYTGAEVRALIKAAYPIGMCSYWDGASPPSGYLVRNGAAISRTTYAELFAQIGTRYGAGNGATTFNLPDDRGLFDRGLDLGRGIDPGRVLGSQQSWATAAPKTQLPTSPNGAFVGNATNLSTVCFVRVSKINEAVTVSGWDSGSSGFEIDVRNPVYGDAETRPENRARLPVIKAY